MARWEERKTGIQLGAKSWKAVVEDNQIDQSLWEGIYTEDIKVSKISEFHAISVGATRKTVDDDKGQQASLRYD